MQKSGDVLAFNKKILIGDNSDDMIKIYMKFLSSKGYDIICRRCSYDLLYTVVSEEKPDILILPVTGVGIDSVEFVFRIKRNFRNVRIIVLSYVTSPVICHRLIAAGIERYVRMPVTIDELIYVINEPPQDTRELFVEPFASDFLEECGFRDTSGSFDFLCAAITACLKNPDLLTDVTALLYPELADAYDTEANIIERIIRHETENIFRNEKILPFLEERIIGSSNERLTNSELIAAAADAFVEKYRLFDCENLPFE